MIEVTDLIKEYGSVRAVDGVSFSVSEGEFFAILGPSGCGKTTTLRMIAGFERPTSGSISIDDEEVSDIPPYHRDTGMVFQGYALFPHKTVGENVGFGLKMQGVPATERGDRVAEMLSLVDLEGFEDRAPGELSGGQKQRVALARALVIEPSVLLLDEPLSNLDRKLRKQMRIELKRIQEEVGVTTLYVTHDQEEALSMSDRVLIMSPDGTVNQVDPPDRIYNRPKSKFTADFVGETNLLTGEYSSADNGRHYVQLRSLTEETIPVSNTGVFSEIEAGQGVVLSIRPEHIDIRLARSTANDQEHVLRGAVTDMIFTGQRTKILVDLSGEEIVVDAPSESRERIEIGDEVTLDWDDDDVILAEVDR